MPVLIGRTGQIKFGDLVAVVVIAERINFIRRVGHRLAAGVPGFDVYPAERRTHVSSVSGGRNDQDRPYKKKKEKNDAHVHFQQTGDRKMPFRITVFLNKTFRIIIHRGSDPLKR
ncbi:MAG: hypothetical protein II940_05955 [Methanosarcinaceae archaeon]|nr:hypothetical protein [Methanosarcinaceae archaeon]